MLSILLGTVSNICIHYTVKIMEIINGNITIDLKPIQDEIVDFYCDNSLSLLCRVCLEKIEANKKICNIFEASKSVHLSTMIMACAAVQVTAGDGLPSTICENCMTKLHIAWQFKIQCENSDLKLRQYYISQQQKQIVHNYDSVNLNVKQDNYSMKHEDTFAQVVHTNISEACTGQLNTSTEITKKVKPLKKLQKSEKSKEQKVHQCDTCGKTFNRREYLTQHIRIHTGEKPYRCHLCEKRFVNSGHLSTHMRTHTGEKPHVCSLCPKAFSTRQELQKHIMVHNGERPYVCKMCGKAFGSSSNLYSHLKHHTGEKNFTCEYCSKAFYTKQELKQHLVVHTGEKAFLCEFCNKRFSQIAHLRRHAKLHT